MSMQSILTHETMRLSSEIETDTEFVTEINNFETETESEISQDSRFLNIYNEFFNYKCIYFYA